MRSNRITAVIGAAIFTGMLVYVNDGIGVKIAIAVVIGFVSYWLIYQALSYYRALTDARKKAEAFAFTVVLIPLVILLQFENVLLNIAIGAAVALPAVWLIYRWKLKRLSKQEIHNA